MRDYSQKVLVFDPENYEALKFIEAAERGLGKRRDGWSPEINLPLDKPQVVDEGFIQDILAQDRVQDALDRLRAVGEQSDYYQSKFRNRSSPRDLTPAAGWNTGSWQRQKLPPD